MRKAMMVAALLGGAARADVAAPSPVPERVARTGVVVVGKVVAVEEKEVSARSPWGADKVAYRQAVVKVDEAVHGAKGQTHVRVGFLPGGRRFAHLTLKVGDEGLFFLTQHPDEPFSTAVMYYDVVPRAGNANFARELDEARRAAKLLAAPEAALMAKDAEERSQAAALVILSARSRPAFRAGGAVRQEPIDASLSRLTLEALADADWKGARPRGYELTPQHLFGLLGVGEADGWRPPPNVNDAAVAAQKWLRDNAGTYWIQKVVVGK